MRLLNPFIGAEQERFREILATMWREEYPVAAADLKVLAPFVNHVRFEIVEDTTPGRRSARRVDYYVLNDLGRQLYLKWLTGGLDKLADEAKRRQWA